MYMNQWTFETCHKNTYNNSSYIHTYQNLFHLPSPTPPSLDPICQTKQSKTADTTTKRIKQIIFKWNGRNTTYMYISG